MPQTLLLARSLNIARASRAQVGNMRNCIEQLARDPRVKSIYGIAGEETGFAALCESPDRRDAERLAALAQVHGQAEVEVIPLLSGEQVLTGLEEAQRVAPAAPQPVISSNGDLL